MYKKSLLGIFFCTLVVLPSNMMSQEDTPQGETVQEEKPKVALVLSGGGAKGIAHIPLIQTLDSLGIVPDMVVGTSMGSVVGGLYAMGYSGDSIAKLAQTAKWNDLLGGTVSLKDVGVEEKSEFQRYLLSLDIVDGKPQIKPSILKDQNLREFFSLLMHPVYNIDNFDELAIPFRAIATDLVNGQKVVLKDGQLGVAVRASMSIPSVFAPVPYNGTLLVDGGVVDNFPVDVAKQMGADIVIGSDVGGGLQPIEELNNMATILFQTSMLTSNLKNDESRAQCDILLDHTKNLTYSTQDFEKSGAIYGEGRIARDLSVPALVELAEKLKQFPQREHQLPEVTDTIHIDRIVYQNISEANLNLVKARTLLEANKSYTTKEIILAIDRAMGTELFFQINYYLEEKNGVTTLNLVVSEKSRHQLSGALHYDTNHGVGLIANYTGRNILGNASRLLVGLDIAEQPRFRVQYQTNFGKLKKWWSRTEFFWERINQHYYGNGVRGDELVNKYNRFNTQFNRNLNPFKSYIGVDLAYEYSNIKPKTDPSVNNNAYDVRRYSFANLELSAHFSYNSFHQVFFAKRGTKIYTRIGRSLVHDVDVSYVEQFEYDAHGSTDGFTKVSFEYERRIPLGASTSIIVGADAGYMFLDAPDDEDISFLDHGHSGKFFLGGYLDKPRRDTYKFQGIDHAELVVTQFTKFNLGCQWTPIRKIYITPYANWAYVGFGGFSDYMKNAFKEQDKWINANDPGIMFSTGVTFSYASFLGPVHLDMSYMNNLNRLQLFFGAGLLLNIPD
ncbi:patatin-like phospholipase family protein [Mangrovimonas sp. TPBH4]|uniref:patatin-like phospholipase family protein n=1 Tax=Mangrovimonas sp. TPBH4 TaxID=1645914 RepID=UPI0006B673B6|nr:patatin-like phospholipase family protein [Mangrovimonas sp. TPBH4]